MDHVPSGTRTMLLVQHRLEEDVTATLSPTEFSTEQKSSSSGSSSSRNRNSNTEPLLTPGEKIGALIGGTISLMIAIYFVLLSVRVRRYRKRQHKRHPNDSRRRKDGWKKHAEEGGKRRRPREIAEQEDGREESANLTIIGGGEFHSDSGDCDSIMAIIAKVPPTKPQNRYDDENDCNDASTIEMASAYSLSSEDGSPRRFSPSRGRFHPKNNNKIRSSAGYGNSKEWSTTPSHSLTSVVLNAILPNRPKDHEESSFDYDSYYLQHNKEDDDETSTSTTISSPFHPSPQPSRITPPRLKRKKKNKTYFMSNDDSVLSETVGGTTVTTEDVFTGIPEEDRPFDCETDAGNGSDDRPFDCVA